MTSTTAPVPAARKKLLNRIAGMTKLAETAKKASKQAKAEFKEAKQKFKEAKRAAKKHRKEIKALKAELAALAGKKKPARKSAAKPAVKPKRLLPAPVPVVGPEATAAVVETGAAAQDQAPAQ